MMDRVQTFKVLACWWLFLLGRLRYGLYLHGNLKLKVMWNLKLLVGQEVCRSFPFRVAHDRRLAVRATKSGHGQTCGVWLLSKIRMSFGDFWLTAPGHVGTVSTRLLCKKVLTYFRIVWQLLALGSNIVAPALRFARRLWQYQLKCRSSLNAFATVQRLSYAADTPCCRLSVFTGDSDRNCNPLAGTAVQRPVARRFPFREKVRGKMMGFIGATSFAATGNIN